MKCEHCGAREADRETTRANLERHGYPADFAAPLYAKRCWVETWLNQPGAEALEAARAANAEAWGPVITNVVRHKAAEARYTGSDVARDFDLGLEMAESNCLSGAWATLDKGLRGERRRGPNRAERRELAKPHPWTVNESDP